MPQQITVQVYERALALPSQRWRWRANGRPAGPRGNRLKLANGGEGYSSQDKLIHALHLLWPSGANSHVVVQLPGRADPIMLAALT